MPEFLRAYGVIREEGHGDGIAVLAALVLLVLVPLAIVVVGALGGWTAQRLRWSRAGRESLAPNGGPNAVFRSTGAARRLLIQRWRRPCK